MKHEASKKITYSAPGKVILSGEHVSIYGKPALICAIPLRLKFSLTLSNKACSDSNISFIADTVSSFLKKIKKYKRDRKFDFRIESDIPIGVGLGSSAALSVVAVAAFLEFFSGEEFESAEINNLAFKIEKRFHKNPSGIDNTVSTFGGLIYFRREFDFLKSIFKLGFKIPKKIEDRLYLINTGKPNETTAEMIDLVGSFYNKNPKKYEKIFYEIEKVTKRIVISAVKEDTSFFENSITENQILLEEIGVVSQKTKNLLRNLKHFGSGKVTGAGGVKEYSGFILFYAKEINKLLLYLKEKKINYFKFKQSQSGVLKES